MNDGNVLVDPPKGVIGLTVHRTNDPGEARALMCTRYTSHWMRRVNNTQKFAFKHISSCTPEGSFNILRYGSAVEIRPEPFEDFFMLEMPVSGGVDIELEDGGSVHSDANHALLIGPQSRFASTWSNGCAQLMLKIEVDQLHKRWQSMVSDDLAVLPELLPQIDLTSPEGWRVKQLMFLLKQEMEQSAVYGENILSATTLGGATIDAVLSYILRYRSADLPNPNTRILPAQLKRCVEYIENNLIEDLSIQILLNIASTSERTLFSLFRQFLHMTPKEFVRSERLKNSRAMLLKGHKSVGDVARLSGFKHMGRFSSQYKSYFGEPPSRTAKR